MIAAVDRKGCTVRGLLWSLIFIPIGILFCSTSVYVAVDSSCHKDATRWLVDYPNAELVEQTHTGFRPFGLGTTIRLLRSPDRELAVKAWYWDHNTELNQQRIFMADSLATMHITYPIVEDNSEVTWIELRSECLEDYIFW